MVGSVVFGGVCWVGWWWVLVGVGWGWVVLGGGGCVWRLVGGSGGVDLGERKDTRKARVV